MTEKRTVGPVPPGSTARRTIGQIGLDDPRAVEILTTEHWSLLSTRALGYQEMFGRTTIFVAVLSGTIVALALLAQAGHPGRQMLWFAWLLISVALFIGLTTFARSVAINYEDALWVAGMDRLRSAYCEVVPGLDQYFVTEHELSARRPALAHGSPQRFANIARSLTTTSSVVAALNSALAGSLASVLWLLGGGGLVLALVLGAVLSLVSAAAHVLYAARFRRTHRPRPEEPPRR